MRVFDGRAGLLAAIGKDAGTSDWLEVGQDRINQFAEATGDDQWIHTDPERAADGPYGSTIAHGYLTLSLIVPLMHGAYRVENRKHAVNYGLNKVRFPAPVPVGSRIRARFELAAAEEIGDAVQATWRVVVEIENSDRPACVAEQVTRYTF